MSVPDLDVDELADAAALAIVRGDIRQAVLGLDAAHDLAIATRQRNVASSLSYLKSRAL